MQIYGLHQLNYLQNARYEIVVKLYFMLVGPNAGFITMFLCADHICKYAVNFHESYLIAPYNHKTLVKSYLYFIKVFTTL